MTRPLPRPWRAAAREPRIGDLVLIPDSDVPHEIIDGPLLKDGDQTVKPPVPGEPYWRCAPVSRRGDTARDGERYGHDHHQSTLVVVEHPLGWEHVQLFNRELLASLLLGDVSVEALRDQVADWLALLADALPISAEGRVGVKVAAKLARDSDLLARMLEGIPPLDEATYHARRSLRLRLTDGETSRLYGTLEAFPEHELTRAIEEAEHSRDAPLETG